MNSIQTIIENQDKYKEEIINFLKNDYEQTKKRLQKIKPADKFIEKEKVKLVKKFKKLKYDNFISRLFFMHSKRHPVFYAWWNEQNEEVNILQYDKR